FFQAEDGIRDGHVTGVQTCALPISQFFEAWVIELDPEKPALRFFDAKTYEPPKNAAKLPLLVENDRMYVMATLEVNDHLTVEHRSEERRVGKECRSGWGR